MVIIMKTGIKYFAFIFFLNPLYQKAFSQTVSCDSVFALLPTEPILIWNDTIIPQKQAHCIGVKSAMRDIRAGRYIYHVYGFLEEYQPAAYCYLIDQGFSIDHHPDDIVNTKEDSFIKGYNIVIEEYLRTKLGEQEYERIFVSKNCRINFAEMARNMVDSWITETPYSLKSQDETHYTLTFDKDKLFKKANEFTSLVRFTFSDKKKTSESVTIDRNTQKTEDMKIAFALSGKAYLSVIVEFVNVPNQYSNCFCSEILNKKHRYVIPINANH